LKASNRKHRSPHRAKPQRSEPGEIERLTREVERLRQELIERDRKLSEAEKQIADLERKLALRLRNARGEGRRARAAISRVASLAIADTGAVWRRRNVSMR